jgi:hypothetical protein
MLDQDTRAAILLLQKQGHGIRAIGRTLRLSKNSVKRVLRSGSAEVPPLEREEILTPHLDYVSDRSYERWIKATVDNILAWMDGAPTNVANPEAQQNRHRSGP